MKPDYEAAAAKACETLVKYRVSYAPVSPFPILKSMPGVIVLSFAEMAKTIGVDRSCVMNNLITQNHDATTVISLNGGRIHYCVAYNQQLPVAFIQRSLARELGHIVLGHDGTRPEYVRNEEAVVFARHLLCPRPLIKSIQDAGVTLTAELFGTTTGCYDRCISCLHDTPGAHVPPELNRLVRSQFEDYVKNLLDYRSAVQNEDITAPVDFGTYMDNYEE